MFAKTFKRAAVAVLLIAFAGYAQAQDAMGGDPMMEGNMAVESMAMDAMAPMMSEDDLAHCLEQARAITFPDVAMVAEKACHNMHNGDDAMGGDAMMSGDTMAPQQ